MLSRILRGVLVLSVVLCGLLGAGSLWAIARMTPLGYDADIWVRSIGDGNEKSILADLEDVLEDPQSNIARYVHDDGIWGVTLYVLRPDIESSSETSFIGINYTIASLQGADLASPIGRWMVRGSEEEIDAVLDVLATHHLAPQRQSVSLLESLSADPAFIKVVAGLSILVTALAVADSVQARRRMSLVVLHGATPARAATSRTIGLLFPLASGCVLLGSIALVLGVSWPRSIGPFLTHSMAYLIAPLGACFAAHWLSGYIIASQGTAELRGEGTLSWVLTPLGWGIRLVAVFVLLASVPGMLVATHELRNHLSYADLAHELGSAVVFSSSGIQLEDESDGAVHDWLAATDRAGNLMYSSLDLDYQGRPYLITNETTLRWDHADVPPSVQRSLDEGWLVLVTNGMPIDPTDLSYSDPDDEELERVVVADEMIIPIRDFNGLGSSALEVERVATMPVLIIPNGAYANYTVLQSTGAVILPDASRAEQEVHADPALASSVLALTPVSQAYANFLSVDYRDVVSSSLAVCIASVSLVISIVASVVIVVRRNARRAFLRHVHGSNILAAYPLFFVGEAIVFLAILLHRVMDARTEVLESTYGTTLGEALLDGRSGITLVIAAGNMLLGLIVLSFIHHRSVIREVNEQ